MTLHRSFPSLIFFLHKLFSSYLHMLLNEPYTTVRWIQYTVLPHSSCSLFSALICHHRSHYTCSINIRTIIYELPFSFVHCNWNTCIITTKHLRFWIIFLLYQCLQSGCWIILLFTNPDPWRAFFCVEWRHHVHQVLIALKFIRSKLPQIRANQYLSLLVDLT